MGSGVKSSLGMATACILSDSSRTYGARQSGGRARTRAPYRSGGKAELAAIQLARAGSDEERASV
eukprot:scaffold31253_cov33-Tisochrysis_lutea.AAC.4